MSTGSPFPKITPDRVSGFEYLGLTVSENGKCKEEPEARIAAIGRLYRAKNRRLHYRTGSKSEDVDDRLRNCL